MKKFCLSLSLLFGITFSNAQDNYLWTWGITINNSYYNVGNYYGNNYQNPWPYTSKDAVPIIAEPGERIQLTANGGNSHSAGVHSNGSLWFWTTNAIDKAPEPFQIGTDTDWKQVCFSNSGRFALKNDGTLWSFGPSYLATQWETASDWDTLISNPGDDEILGIKTNGSLWLLKNNTAGTPETITQIGSDTGWAYASLGEFLYAIKSDGTMWKFDELTNPPVQIGTDTDWRIVNHTGSRVIALKTNKTLWAMGEQNSYGQLGLGHNTPVYSLTQIGTDTDWEWVCSGDVHSYALKTNGTLFGWGRNNYRQLGNGNTTDQNAPVQLNSYNDWQMVVSGPNHGVGVRSQGFSNQPTISLNEMNHEQVELFPNPFGESITIQSETAFSKILLFDNLGQVIQIIPTPITYNSTINTSELKPGIYHMNIEYANGQISQHKLVK